MNCLWHAAQYCGVLNRRLLNWLCSSGYVRIRKSRATLAGPAVFHCHKYSVGCDIVYAAFPFKSVSRIAWQAMQETPSWYPCCDVRSFAKMFFVPENREIGSWQPPQYLVDSAPFCFAIVVWMNWKSASIEA